MKLCISWPAAIMVNAILNENLNLETSVCGGPVSRCLYSVAVGNSKRFAQWKTCPTRSFPRRPARPAICVYSCGYRRRIVEPLNLLKPTKMTVLVGIFKPTANVSVASKSLINPFSNSNSTISRKTGKIPAWWIAIPFSKSLIIVWYSGKSIYSW